MSDIVIRDIVFGQPAPGARPALQVAFAIAADMVVDFNLRIDIGAADADAPLLSHFLSEDGWDVCWLPRGDYSVNWEPPLVPSAGGELQVTVYAYAAPEGTSKEKTSAARRVKVFGTGGGAKPMQLCALGDTPAIESLGWKKGYGDWFYIHFAHAARTIVSYICGDSPLLKGHILDVGCGDGITDLGIALRLAPQRLVGIDPFKGFERLPQILKDNHLGHVRLPGNLEFMAEDANALPFPDDSFDAVISWGSVEHMAGGYRRALLEMRRVLKPDGLLFVTPGLFYSNIGHHLGEFSDEPFFHLTKSHEEVRDLVLNGEPRRIDRSGHIATPQEYWQWYNELNRITVPKFEEELRALDFEPWRIALRVDQLVEYRKGMHDYRICDLAPLELYSSWYNRKKPA